MTLAARPRVVLHVGAPKTGTTFLQQALWRNREALRKQGFHLPGSRQVEMFEAAVEVRESFAFWGMDEDRVRGTWARLCRAAASASGTTIMSHEVLASASRAQAEAALAELGDVELHVVFTARDVSRQVVSEWQERIKNGGKERFASYRRTLEESIDRGDDAAPFWLAHDVVSVLDRWAAALPPEQVHVVVCPPSGADPVELWHRFGDACGFDARALDPHAGAGGPGGEDGPATNRGLGVVEVALLRQVNRVLDGRIKQPTYSAVVKRRFAQKLLSDISSPRYESGPLRAPAELVDLLRPWAVRRNEELLRRGVRVYGDPAALVPGEADDDVMDPDRVPAEVLRSAAMVVIAHLLIREARRVEGNNSSPEPAPERRLLGFKRKGDDRAR